MNPAFPHQPRRHDGGAVALRPAPGMRLPGAVRTVTAEGNWPRTTRVFPWLLAIFLVGLFLTPLDRIQLPVRLPFDSKLDRFLVGFLVLVWLGSKVFGRSTAVEQRRRITLIQVGVLFFVIAALTSILVNAETLTKLAEYEPAIKKLAVLVAFALFFCVVASVVRPAEVRAFTVLILGLASVTAVGVVYEYHSDVNVFSDWTASILPAGVELDVADSGIDGSGREGTVGPAGNTLAIATMLSLTLPFAVVGIFRARTLTAKLPYLVATWAILGATIATQRKSAILVPAAVAAVLLAYRPQQMLRLVPVMIVMVAAVPILSPGALTEITERLVTKAGVGEDRSTKGRTKDYDAVRPDVRSHIAFGRGFGSYDHRRYRALDNQYLGLLVETGSLGVAAYLLMVVGVGAVAHSVIKSRDPVRGPPALAIAAAAVAFGVASAFYDVLAFPHVPYLFLFMAGLAVACAAGRPQVVKT